MKITLTLNDALLKQAMKDSGIKQKTALIHKGLQLLIQEAASNRLINMGGKFKNLEIRRRRKTHQENT